MTSRDDALALYDGENDTCNSALNLYTVNNKVVTNFVKTEYEQCKVEQTAKVEQTNSCAVTFSCHTPTHPTVVSLILIAKDPEFSESWTLCEIL